MSQNDNTPREMKNVVANTAAQRTRSRKPRTAEVEGNAMATTTEATPAPLSDVPTPAAIVEPDEVTTRPTDRDGVDGPAPEPRATNDTRTRKRVTLYLPASMLYEPKGQDGKPADWVAIRWETSTGDKGFHSFNLAHGVRYEVKDLTKVTEHYTDRDGNPRAKVVYREPQENERASKVLVLDLPGSAYYYRGSKDNPKPSLFDHGFRGDWRNVIG